MTYQHSKLNILNLRIFNLKQVVLTWILFYLFLYNSSCAQSFSKSGIIKEVSSKGSKIILFQDSSQLQSYLSTQLNGLLGEGYLNARIDTFSWNDTLYIESFHGQKFSVQSHIRFSEKNLQISHENLDSAYFLDLRHQLERFENNGYPFVSLKLDSVREQHQNTQLFWNLDRGPFVTIDSVVVQSSDPIPINYLLRYLDIRKGQPYNEKKLSELTTRIREIPFLEPSGPVEVIFKLQSAVLFLKVKKRKANTFNGIIGLRPNENTGEILFTGDVDLRVINALNKGEDIQLIWKRLQTQTQELILGVKTPFILNRPISVDGLVRIYRRDTTFSQFRGIAGVSVALSGGASIRLFTETNQSNRLAQNSLTISTGNADLTLYGLGIKKQNLDYLYNPLKGYLVQLESSVGTRNSVENETGNQLRENVLRAEWNMEFYIPIFPKNTLKLQNMGSTYQAEGLFTNELYRIGGLRSIRGFDEESIFATNWTVTTIEYRIIPELNTALYAFLDYGWYERKDDTPYLRDVPYSFGLGANFPTKAGIFTFNYALGQQFDNPMLLRNAKVSFGFRNVF